jgi:metal-responsive CopG/Arc/MetJ family transcriptional regulator
MRNVTLSFPDDLIEKGKDYARKHDMSLNALIRDAFRRMIESETKDSTAGLFAALDSAAGKSGGDRWTRDEIYRG